MNLEINSSYVVKDQLSGEDNVVNSKKHSIMRI